MEPTPKPKSRWRFLRWLLITVAVLATLIALFYTEEDVRGKMEWDSYRNKLVAQGEKLNAHDFTPPSVPDDQNFFTAPFFQSKEDKAISAYGKYQDFPSTGYWAEGRMTDLAKFQSYYRHSTNEFPIASRAQTPAADVLLALSKYDSAVEELRLAGLRPYSNIPLNYDEPLNAVGTLTPYLAAIKRCSTFLELRALAELANGQSDKACDDVKLLLRLNDSLRTQPFLISHLVRIAVLHITLQPIWEGTVNHQWTDGQLAQINDELAKQDLLDDFQSAMRSERVFAIQLLESERVTHEYQYVDEGGETKNVYFRLTPAALFYQNELTIARLDQDWALPLVDTNAHTASPKKWEQANEYVQEQLRPFAPYKNLALATFQVVGPAVRRFAFAQSSVDLAQVACALERYHLAHNEYPLTLDALTPQYLEQVPNDVIGGQPLHYNRTSDGKYLLYSVGWNETDDGGHIGLNKTGHLDITKGDWVWPVTAK
jgi:hypothetical protein